MLFPFVQYIKQCWYCLDIFGCINACVGCIYCKFTISIYFFVWPSSLYFELLLHAHMTVTGLHVFDLTCVCVCQVGAELCRGNAADQFCVKTKISQSHPGAHGLLQISFHRHSHRHLQKPRCTGSRYDIQYFFKSASPQLIGFEAVMFPQAIRRYLQHTRLWLLSETERIIWRRTHKQSFKQLHFLTHPLD